MRTNKKNPLLLLLPIGSIVSLLFICCKAPVVESSWPKGEIVINGKLGDWQEPLNYSLSDQFGIGVANDGRYLYLCITADDRKTEMRILRSGLTVWFQGSASKHERLGIHFPIGMGGAPGTFRLFHGGEVDTEMLREKTEEASQQLEIIGPKKDDSIIMKAAIAESYGIQLKLASSAENLVYEAKIPLHSDSTALYALNPGNDSLIDVQIESPAPEAGAEAHQGGENGGGEGGMGGRGMGGGMGGGMGHGGGHGGGGYGGSHAAPEPLKAALIIKLANKPMQ